MEPLKHWTLEVQKLEDGDEYIEFPKEVLEEVGWQEGDVIEWLDNKDGSWTLRKKLDDNHENTDASNK
jgi:bifunctional DNA-binding transcriptional regulator/antitoxin component of YhaV-PrlF toxin-antitoxin module